MDIKTDYRLPPAITANDTQVFKQKMADTAGLKDKESTLQTTRLAKNEVEASKTLAADTEVDRDTLETAVSNMQDFTQNIQRNLNFTISENTGRTIVEVTDSASGEVIRQLPTEEALRLAESLDEMRSLLFTAQA